MVEPSRAVWYLKKIPLLAELPPDLLVRITGAVELRDVQRRTVIYLPGDPGASVFFVNGGRVRTSKVTPEGKELTLAYRAPGDLFGEACLLEGGAREELAEAMEHSLVTEVPRPLFDRLAAEHAAFGWRLARILLARRRELEARVELLVFKDVNARLASLLLHLGTEYGVDDDRGVMVALKITHQEMANLIGSTRETVSLALSAFRKRGLIDTDGRKVILADRDGLQALS